MTEKSEIRNHHEPSCCSDDKVACCCEHVAGRRYFSKAILGLAVVAAGVLMTLDNLNIVETDRYLDFWPVLLILLGVSHLAQPAAARRVVSGLVWITIGAVLLVHTLDLVDFNPFDLWPLLLVLVGGSILAHALRRGRRLPVEGSDTFDATAILSGVERRITNDSFQGGEAIAVLGGCEIDLRDAGSKGGPAEIHCFAFWGGVEIKVPETWQVEVRGTALLGAFEDKTVAKPAEGSKTLVVTGIAIMGGVEVKN